MHEFEYRTMSAVQGRVQRAVSFTEDVLRVFVSCRPQRIWFVYRVVTDIWLGISTGAGPNGRAV
jgi:hypothetical protein